MAFPVSPTDGQQSTIANIVYQYASATNAWTVIPGYANTISATGNITASYFIGNGSQLTGVVATGVTGMTYGTTSFTIPAPDSNVVASVSGTSNVVVLASTGQYVTGLISATGNITASGNISGSYLLGNAYFVTGLSPTQIYNGTSQVNIGTSDGNANISIGGTSNVVVVATTGVIVSGIISATGNISSSANVSGANVIASANLVSVGAVASGNITGGNLLTGGLISAAGNITGSGHVGTIYTNSIINTGANGTGNIGSSSLYFNTVFAKATSAQYADLAEMYHGDESYMPGTVVEFGGPREITITTELSSTRIAGVVSTNPSYLMNSGLTALNAVPVALTGRVPCQVVGPVRKGDRLVSSMLPGVAQVLDEETYRPGCMIGKSLEDWPDATVKLIEVVVGRL
jgi:hypothetical protein